MNDRPVAPGELPTIVLRGIGQVMFQEHPITGTFFLAGLVVASATMALGALVGAVAATLTAVALRYDASDVRAGLYGFNGALVGVALLFYDEVGAIVLLLLIVGAAASTVLAQAMRHHLAFPAYTAPFILVTWVMLAIARGLGVFAGPPASEASSELSLAQSITDGISEVMFQANSTTGLLFVAGIALSNWRHALWALAGSTLGVLAALADHDSAGSISLGIYGYNAALAAMALWLYRPSLVLPILAALASVPLTEFFPRLGLETLTAPFVLASWLTLLVARLEPAD